jgi:hypothetical protein
MQIDFSTDQIIIEKINAIKQVYHDWGFILRRALRQLSPTDRGNLRSAIRFRVESPKNLKDITGTVRLLVGILEPSSPVLRYLKFVVDGSRPHFVPIKTRGGKNTGILGWMQRHNLVYFGETPEGGGRSAWRWKEGINRGRLFNGIAVDNEGGNDMFNIVYNRYYAQINAEIQSILRS